ncbi:hypothetical protein KFE25_013791 [Diacronema lutheri]|uniref:Phosphorylated adapter RNA export protein n=1 Tax=Diacronema lutheri TaxID=2081491 RepID=A0A8J5XJ83_DIALT|nr:hypothetical protein KFE25_013791 [Diacronema lutheri]
MELVAGLHLEGFSIGDEPCEGEYAFDEQDRAILHEILGRREQRAPDGSPPRKPSARKRDPLACLTPLSPNADVDSMILAKAPISSVAQFVIERLGESNVELVHALVGTVGADMALRVLKRAMRIEAQGGVLCPAAAPTEEAKRKTAGGVWISLIRRADGVSAQKVNKVIKSVEKRQRRRKWSPDRGTTAEARRKQSVVRRLDKRAMPALRAAPAHAPPVQTGTFKRPAVRRSLLPQ